MKKYIIGYYVMENNTQTTMTKHQVYCKKN